MSTDGVMIVPISKPFKDILGFDEVRELHEGDLSLLRAVLGSMVASSMLRLPVLALADSQSMLEMKLPPLVT